MNKSILIEADEIINKRKQEKVRQYGPVSESLERAAEISSIFIVTY